MAPSSWVCEPDANGSRLTRCPLTSGESFSKVAGSAGRIGTLDAIEARAREVFDRIPITRVTDIGRLDTCGVSVFAAVTPLAKDLTTHMGKGVCARTARVSAVMEAVERVSAEAVPGDFRRGSFRELRSTGIAPVDPERFDLPPTTGYRPDKAFDWVAGWDLIGARQVWIPVDLARSPAAEGLLDQVDTNGLAAGASYGEAIRHALLEVIERDTVSQHQYFELFGDRHKAAPPRRRINSATLPETAQGLIAKLRGPRNEIVLEDITGDLGIPIVCCSIVDRDYPAPHGATIRVFGGWGADLCAEAALNRAITEAYQSRVGFIQGARDSFNVVPQTPRTFTDSIRQAMMRDMPTVNFDTLRSFAFDDIAKDVDFLIGRLGSIGIDQVIVIDLTSTKLELPVVRVRVPGLSVFVVDRKRPGWRCARHLL